MIVEESIVGLRGARRKVEQMKFHVVVHVRVRALIGSLQHISLVVHVLYLTLDFRFISLFNVMLFISILRLYNSNNQNNKVNLNYINNSYQKKLDEE